MQFVFGKTSKVPRIRLEYSFWVPQANALKPRHPPEFIYNVLITEKEGNVEVTIERPSCRYVGIGTIDAELFEELKLLATRGIYKRCNIPKSGKTFIFNGFPSELGEELANALNELAWYNRNGYLEMEFRYIKQGKALIDGTVVNISGEILYGRFEGKTHYPPATQMTLDKFLNVL